MSSNPLGVQIIYGLRLAKAPEPMTPPHLQIYGPLLLHDGQDCLRLLTIDSFKKPSFAIHLSTTMQWAN